MQLEDAGLVGMQLSVAMLVVLVLTGAACVPRLRLRDDPAADDAMTHSSKFLVREHNDNTTIW